MRASLVLLKQYQLRAKINVEAPLQGMWKSTTNQNLLGAGFTLLGLQTTLLNCWNHNSSEKCPLAGIHLLPQNVPKTLVVLMFYYSCYSHDSCLKSDSILVVVSSQEATPLSHKSGS
ncbi:hypothetical protein ANCCAN_00001 [Ancylostoma caninum]|uniref:Uncharacterized protein n=1 Tax=Ancylostoma caninum TaxID=29170 RepID=A0A368HCT1_ANCCA|nr:hypothetical protein ANCCAN_00001 [Ancylostoma caninum]